MGWGASITGLGGVLDAFGDIRQRWDGDTLYLAGPQVEYAIYNEMGTSKMEARPFMQPAAERVANAPVTYAKRYGNGFSSEAEFVRDVALAVQGEAKRIADQKGVRDTGALIASISIQRVK